MKSIKRTIGSAALVGTLFIAGVGCGTSGSKADFCKTAKSADAKDYKPTDGEKFTAMLDKLQKDAPSEIKGDMKTLSDAMKVLAKDPTDIKSIDQEKVQKASDNIEKYLKDKCGIDTES